MNAHLPFRLDNEIALITGGGTGIGYAIAECFVAAGAKVVIVGRRENVLVDACKTLGPAAAYRVHDICQFDGNDGMVKSIAKEIGSPTILVNNAGTHFKKPAADVTVEEFKALMDTHVFAAHSLCRAVIPSMVAAKKGSILFTASMTSFIGMPLVIAYTTAKTSYVGMVHALASDYSGQGVRVNAIAPGWIQTPLLDKALSGDDARRNKILSRTPMNRFGEPADIGWAAVYLCSPAAKFVTGTVLAIDGGASMAF